MKKLSCISLVSTSLNSNTMRLILPLLLLFAVAKGQTDSFYLFKSGKYELTVKGASHFASLPLKCIEKEFPYKAGYTLSGPEMLLAPKNIHPTLTSHSSKQTRRDLKRIWVTQI